MDDVQHKCPKCGVGTLAPLRGFEQSGVWVCSEQRVRGTHRTEAGVVANDEPDCDYTGPAPVAAEPE